MRGLRLALVIAFLGTAGVAAGDEWTVPKPKSAGSGEALLLRKELADAQGMPLARMKTRQVSAWTDGRREVVADFDLAASPDTPDAQGRPHADLLVDLGRLVVSEEDFAPRVRASKVEIGVRVTLDAKGVVRGGAPRGTEQLGSLGPFLRPAGSWVLPYLPEKAVRVGDAWDLPIPYFLWSINQPGDVPAKGFVTQVFEAVEERGGTRCARLRTVVSLERTQPKGMTPPDVGIGEGAALARFRAEGTTWMGLDGCLREDLLDVRMRVENTATKAWLEWTFHREATAQPRSAGALPKEWSRLMGDVPFVLGWEAGRAEGKFAGRPLMCLVVSYGDADSEVLALGLQAARTRERLSAYLPVLVDREAPGTFPHMDVVAHVPGVVFVDLDGDQVFVLAGAMPVDLFVAAAEVPAARAPAPEPTPEYLALEKERDAMRAAIERKDAKAALAAVRAIQAVGMGHAIQVEAGAADTSLTADGTRRIDEARALGAKGKSKEARTALEAIAADYDGHPVAAKAREAIAALPAPKKKP